ncbi:MAG: DUF2330 domain-containing protein [Gammaproteobacteria bacterium]
MKKPILLLSLIAMAFMPLLSQAFCGFYVAKADSKLFNEASQVVMVRDEDRTVLTMSNDFKGDVKDFAMVIPVPTILQREQIHVTDNAIIDHLDSYSAPRLVEYFDDDPCMRIRMLKNMAESTAMMDDGAAQQRANSLGVKIEASYTVGEYDILILAAEQSNGLITWLKENNYRIPDGAESVVNSYIKQDMKFFVAKVNLKEQSKLGFANLRPIQVAYESPKFMLPIRLGMLNANGAQELYVYALTKKGRVETTNYRTVKMPTGMELPAYIKDDFGNFYLDMFRSQVKKENNRAVFLEYAWDMNWCDPCAADPLSDEELKELGVFWLNDQIRPTDNPNAKRIMPQAKDVFISRLHVRYDQENFPEDLFFQQTGDRENFQGRYVIKHPWNGEAKCPAAEEYLTKTLPKRNEQEIKTLANLTGWDINDIRNKVPNVKPAEPVEEIPWWKQLWNE